MPQLSLHGVKKIRTDTHQQSEDTWVRSIHITLGGEYQEKHFEITLFGETEEDLRIKKEIIIKKTEDLGV